MVNVREVFVTDGTFNALTDSLDYSSILFIPLSDKNGLHKNLFFGQNFIKHQKFIKHPILNFYYHQSLVISDLINFNSGRKLIVT